MGNWFADRLGAPPEPVVARYSPNQPWPPQAPYPQQQPLPGQQHPLLGQQQMPFDPRSVRIDDVNQLLALKDAWHGTVEEKRNTELCPKCGGQVQLYTQLNAPKIMNKDGVSCQPMQRCHFCGYNGHFEQLGQQATDTGIAIRAM
jgi:hypothetical protein